jgi:hypothetical protein
MRDIIALSIANYPLALLILGFIAAGVALARSPGPLPAGAVAEAIFAYYLLFALGLSYLVNFVMHVFFQDIASKFIGWAPSPFETEVGFASLGFGLVAILAFRGSYGLRLGAVLGPAMFLLGAAGGHVYQMVTAHNFAPGNAGAIFYTDIAVPLIGFALLAATRPARAAGGSTI